MMHNFFQIIIAYRLTVKQRRILVPIVLVMLLAVVAACGPSAGPDSDEAAAGLGAEPTAESLPAEEEAQPVEAAQANPAQESYPPSPPEIAVPEEDYPAETLPPPTVTPFPDVYPPPATVEVFAEPRIRLDLPIAVGDTIVSGTAPPGLALAVVDVTYNGTLLGSGKTGDDGRFDIQVGGLLEGNRLGLTFDELEPGMSLADMSIKYYPHRGEGFMNLPNVGVMLDSTLIQP